ncbi:MAG: 5-methylthioadenosine/S-adenosylhomocysteine deaminase [Petroclostridium sp.]|jgi:5-methylthioadenosine/S-adenosylhomocysteine deaminase|uniref:amidohydrolase n=1 Tax=Petroclostridium xylanilyticum TaxID=1792311 RepID=UPI000B996DCF|nr:amidohydrolase [Petroclostridium xylanilyticum]MBZ4645999.1 cytosine deaminase [Clostridia bacterium]MDK2810134.1 5-methylthioadenosine/S-adenosylhomocysteine deaminase [Petroclostridium sp.]
MNTLIKNATIVTMEDENKVVHNGYIAIVDDRITYVGETLPEDFLPQVIIEGRDRVVLPGLINAHTHTPMVLLRSYADDLPLQEWLFEKIFPIEDKFAAEDVYWASMLGIMEMLRSGITCFADMYFFMDEVVKAVSRTGIRANLSRGLQCFEPDFNPTEDRRLLENEQLFKDWDGESNGRIRIFLGPHSVYTCVPDYLEDVAELAQKLGTGIHIHISETLKENQECLEKYGKTPVRHLYDLGIFKAHTIAAHCVHVSEEDMDILKENDVSVVYNPGSNLKLGSGITPVRNMLAKGINIALGTDGASSNNNLNMFEEIHLAALVSKGVEKEPTLVKAYDALKMATVHGAMALGIKHEVGIIKPGMKADLTIVNLNKPHFYPQHNVIANLAYSAQAADVETVLVDGRILMEKGEFKTVDDEEVIYNINKISKRIFE